MGRSIALKNFALHGHAAMRKQVFKAELSASDRIATFSDMSYQTSGRSGFRTKASYERSGMSYSMRRCSSTLDNWRNDRSPTSSNQCHGNLVWVMKKMNQIHHHRRSTYTPIIRKQRKRQVRIFGIVDTARWILIICLSQSGNWSSRS